MNAVLARLGPTLGLLYGSAYWGVVWYPTRLLEGMGMQGPWLTLLSYGAAFLVFTPFARFSMARLRRQPRDALVLLLAAGWTNVAFVLAVIAGEVVRVVLLFYLSPIWAVLLGRWLLHEALSPRSWLMLGLGMGGALIMLWDPAVGRVPFNQADVLAASAGLAFALNNVMTRRITSLAVREKTYIAWLGVVVVSALMVVLWFPQIPQAPAVVWWATIALGVFGFLLSTLAVVYGVTHMPIQRSAVIMLFELVVGAATAWWLAGERISPQEWIGGALILSAAMIAILQEERTT